MLLKAALSHFIAERDCALANLNAYLNGSVGIGEHPDLASEVVKLIEKSEHANSCINLINSLGSDKSESEEENNS